MKEVENKTLLKQMFFGDK